MAGNDMTYEVVVPYGNSNGAFHLRFGGDYKTFCGRNCEGWLKIDKDAIETVESAYCCSRCRTAFYK